MPEKKNPAPRRIIAWALLAAALLTLLLPWITVRIRFGSNGVSIRDALGMFGESFTEEQLEEALVDMLEDTEEPIAEYGVTLDMKGTTVALMDLIRGDLNPYRAARAARAIGKLMKLASVAAAQSPDDLDPTERSILEMLSSLGRRLQADAALFWILGLLLVFSGLYAAWSVYAGKPRGLLPFMGAALALLLLTGIAVSLDNGILRKLFKMIAAEEEQIFSDLWLGNTIKLFRMTAAPVLCLLAACLAWCALVVKGDFLEGLGISFGVWTCPVCGEKASAKASFCPNCGTRRLPLPDGPAPEGEGEPGEGADDADGGPEPPAGQDDRIQSESP